ncbi:MAG TPA: agmatine deiminase family protein [Campylobacterales bacterium]|nr:agmatine deiminase family protein [Campylobacterales bacterium]HIP41486.1 agmatine deiminase family protein [Campylobacterales bacterium]
MKHLPPEWANQRAILMAFPHKNSDWADNLNSALTPFIRIAQAIAYSQPVYIVCDNRDDISGLFCSTRNMSFIEIPTNDTWIRDYGYISIIEDGETKLLDFTFDGWGKKFEATLDNRLNYTLHKKGYMGTTPLKSIKFVLEGGSIESDGEGTILTTNSCLCNPNRNGGLSKKQIEEKLNEYLGTKRVLWLDYGYLAGDDTDSHIDTLARFISVDTIVYVQCLNVNDEHHSELQKMEKQLKSFKTLSGVSYNLIPLPMASKKLNAEGHRLPATYANFLITNKALIYPTYSVIEDKMVHEIFKKLFPKREIIPIECSRLIQEGGSLHCSTMQTL